MVMTRTFAAALSLFTSFSGSMGGSLQVAWLPVSPQSIEKYLSVRPTRRQTCVTPQQDGWCAKFAQTRVDTSTRLVSPLTTGEEAKLGKDAHDRSMFIFGVGYVATAVALSFLRKGWTVYGTCTDPRKVKSLGEQGIKAFIFDDWSGPMMQPEPLEALSNANCVLSTVPPSLQTGMDPVLVAHEAELEWAYRKGCLEWIGYLSSTGVYGDRGGGWVTEKDEPWPMVARTKTRLKAERSWLRLHRKDRLPVHVFRLAGIYGPGRSALDAVARYNGDIRLAGADDGTHVSRIHVQDIVSVLESSVEYPCPGDVVNVADDLPSTRYETLAFGCKLLGYPRQDPDPDEKNANRRGGGNKRVDNEKMRALLTKAGRTMTFPDYRSGLRAVQEGDTRPFSLLTAMDNEDNRGGVPAADSGQQEQQFKEVVTTYETIGSGKSRGEGEGQVAEHVGTRLMEREMQSLSSKVDSLSAKLDLILMGLESNRGDAGKGFNGNGEEGRGEDVVEGAVDHGKGSTADVEGVGRQEGRGARVGKGGVEVVTEVAEEEMGDGESDAMDAFVIEGKEGIEEEGLTETDSLGK